jgi:hypothetical protein
MTRISSGRYLLVVKRPEGLVEEWWMNFDDRGLELVTAKK